MTIKTIMNSDMSVAYITDCATSPVTHSKILLDTLFFEKFIALIFKNSEANVQATAAENPCKESATEQGPDIEGQSLLGADGGQL
jgi:hypothetical protein